MCKNLIIVGLVICNSIISVNSFAEELIIYQKGFIEAEKDIPYPMYITVKQPIEPISLGVQVKYREYGDNEFLLLNMHPSSEGPGIYNTNLPRKKAGTKIEYYFRILTSDGQEIIEPTTAPDKLLLLIYVGMTNPVINIIYYIFLCFGFLTGLLIFRNPVAGTIPLAAKKVWMTVLVCTGSLVVAQIPFQLIRSIQRTNSISFDLPVVVLVLIWAAIGFWWILTQGRSMKNPFIADLKALQKLVWSIRIGFILSLIVVLFKWLT
jgi:hypothetical protein